MFRTLSILVSVFLIACGAPEGTSEGTPEDSNKGTSSATGSDTTELLSSFGYEKIKTDVSGYGAFAAQADGTNIFQASVFLYADKSFALFYREGEGSVDAGGGGGNFPTKGKVARGQWSWN